MALPEDVSQQTTQGGAIFRKSLGGCLTLIVVLACILAVILIGSGGFRWIKDYFRESSIPYDQIYVEAKGEWGGGENDAGWTIYYVIHNDSSKLVELTLNTKLPVTFSDCQAAGMEATTVNFQTYSYQAVVVQASIPPNQSVSGTAYATYDEDSGRSKGYFMCWQLPGCDSYYGCRQYEIGMPIFIVARTTSSPVQLRVERLP